MSHGRFELAVWLSRSKGSLVKGSLFGIDTEFAPVVKWALNAFPFLAILVCYGIASHVYLLDNPSGKLLPSYGQMAGQLWELATVPSRRSQEILLWIDIFTSLQRLLGALAVSAVLGLFLGLTMAFVPFVRELWLPFITFMTNVPIIAGLAIIMIAFGTGELFKFVLIFLGTFFLVTRDVHRSAEAFPKQQITKAKSLGASDFGTVFRLMLPQVMPHLLTAIKFVLGAAWIYLISSEMIASQEGMGYRIFLVRRYMDMSTIIPYMAIITLIAFALDGALRMAITRLYPWYQAKKD